MQYVALLRGIGPGNPNMRNEKLREVFEGLGFKNVRSVISSGNILFESSSKNIEDIEDVIEDAWPKKLGFNSTTIIRSHGQLKKLLEVNPYGKTPHNRESYQLVTFFKDPPRIDFDLPYSPVNKTYKLIAFADNALFTTTDTTSIKTPDVMSWLERQFGKQITSRTYKTVERIVKKFEA